MTSRDILLVRLTEAWGVEVSFGPVFILIVLVLTALYFILRFILLKRRERFEVVAAEIKLGNIGGITIRPSYEEVQIAHKAWTELATRKAALVFDEEDDVVAEVYNSWYELFGRMRDLVKEVPARKLRSSPDTRELVRLLVDALNNGLRPHLTKWQAKFHRWYETQLESQKGIAPQAIQRQFPEYQALVKDLKAVNKQIVEYADVLRRISQG